MLYDLKDKSAPILHHTELTLSSYSLPPFARSHNVNATFTSSKLSLIFESPRRDQKLIRVEAPIHDFSGSFAFSYKTPHHTITTVNPASADNKVNFNFGTKVYCIEVNGVYKVKGEEYKVSKGVGMHDHGRGTPPYKTMWVWGSIVTKLSDGRMLGVNLGTGDKPGINFTTDAICIDGVIHKLGVVNVHFDNEDVVKQPWKIKTVSAAPEQGSKAALDLLFKPERVSLPL